MPNAKDKVRMRHGDFADRYAKRTADKLATEHGIVGGGAFAALVEALRLAVLDGALAEHERDD